MRRSLAAVALAVTSMVALSFLIPLAVLVASQARTQAHTAAEQRAGALAPVLALTVNGSDLRQVIASLDADDRLGVHLPGGEAVGVSHAPQDLLQRALDNRESLTHDVTGGWIYLQPVVLAGDRVAVVESFVPGEELTHGVTVSWAVMAFLALGLVLGSTALADRLATRVVRSSTNLSRAANTFGSGDLHTRVDPMGPPELYEAGLAFNAMADRMVELLAIERELVADLSHRLRTPLTALQLATERMGRTTDAQRIAGAVAQLESELHSIITAARTPLATSAMGTAFRASAPTRATGRPAPHTEGPTCEVGDVVRRRALFWAVLAQQQDRPYRISVTTEPTTVDLPEDDVAAVLDALIGNVFRHTSDHCAFAVTVERTSHALTLAVEDAGPGIADPQSALARGASSSSTGLGLDIARRAAAATHGELDITRSSLGGARIAVSLGLSRPPPRPAQARARRRARRCATPCWRGRARRAMLPGR